MLGNLSLGGTGKTPHAALILSMLRGKKAAFLSRGYGRSSEGTVAVNAESTAEMAGDEPLLISRKHTEVRVVVDENRLRGIEYITKRNPNTEIIVLDDALQHRKIKGGLNILLTTWQEPFFNDHVLPAGNLRDTSIRAKGAQAVIVTKCPDNATAAQKKIFRSRLAYLGIPIYFSSIAYGKIKPVNTSTVLENPFGESTPPELQLLLVTGIANPALFAEKVASKYHIAQHFAFGDHHQFSKSDFQRFREFIGSFAPGRAALLTTEKDAMRMMNTHGREMLVEIPAYYWEIEARLNDDSSGLIKLITTYVEHP